MLSLKGRWLLAPLAWAETNELRSSHSKFIGEFEWTIFKAGRNCYVNVTQQSKTDRWTNRNKTGCWQAEPGWIRSGFIRTGCARPLSIGFFRCGLDGSGSCNHVHAPFSASETKRSVTWSQQTNSTIRTRITSFSGRVFDFFFFFRVSICFWCWDQLVPALQSFQRSQRLSAVSSIFQESCHSSIDHWWAKHRRVALECRPSSDLLVTVSTNLGESREASVKFQPSSRIPSCQMALESSCKELEASSDSVESIVQEAQSSLQVGVE